MDNEPEKAAELLAALEVYRLEVEPAKDGRMEMPEYFKIPEVWGEIE